FAFPVNHDWISRRRPFSRRHKFSKSRSTCARAVRSQRRRQPTDSLSPRARCPLPEFRACAKPFALSFSKVLAHELTLKRQRYLVNEPPSHQRLWHDGGRAAVSCSSPIFESIFGVRQMLQPTDKFKQLPDAGQSCDRVRHRKAPLYIRAAAQRKALQ